jgi:hypothetical protein
MLSIGLPELLVLLGMLPILAVTVVIPYWKIFGKAGFNKWLAFLMFVPIVDTVILWFFAFSRWTVAMPPPMPARAACTKCGNPLTEEAPFCAFCGSRRT